VVHTPASTLVMVCSPRYKWSQTNVNTSLTIYETGSWYTLAVTALLEAGNLNRWTPQDE
jgi:hypothetical protein